MAVELGIEEARQLVVKATVAAGANMETAVSLADATVAAELSGHPAVGLAHLPDYLAGLKSGRISGIAEPQVHFPTPATISVDAKKGIAQLGFDQVFERFVENVKQYGVSIFAQTNSYTAGELGYYTRRLAEVGLISLATSNGPAMVTTSQSRQPLYGTNPLSFAAPISDGRPVVIDQASSATAFVNIRDAAARGEQIPENWALDSSGESTTDPRDAMAGILLAFGGSRGANIALMVEVLSAGLTGAKWSLDAPSFNDGDQSPGIGLFIVAINPTIFSQNFSSRFSSQVDRLRNQGVYIPGRSLKCDQITISPSLLSTIEEYSRER